jgi:hypothetical protein
MQTFIYNGVTAARKCCLEDAPLLLALIRESVKEVSARYFILLSDLRQVRFLCVSTAHGQFGLHTACHWLKKRVYLSWLDLREEQQRHKDQQKPERERRGQLSAFSISV